MKQWQSFLVVFVLIICVAIQINRDTLASLVWVKYRQADISVVLNRSNVELAMFIGNYHFNGVIGGGVYDLDIAQKAYQKAVSINPKILWGHYQLARTYFVEGDFEQALEEITKELEANPENLRSLYVRGLIYGYRNFPGDLTLAENDFRRFIDWAPKEWAGYNDLAWILLKEEKYGQAREIIIRAFGELATGDRSPWLWNSKGVAELNLGFNTEARKSFNKAKELAATLTNEEWQIAYTGNDPIESHAGLEIFREAIDLNIARVPK